ncbi:LCP family protein [Schwartzia sp. (in: firmicutes)]|nr:LCP family protein [Schwartzia sp. (in: firmicutes)]
MRKRRGGKRRIYTRAIYFLAVIVIAFLAGFGGWRLLGTPKTVKEMPGSIKSEMTKEIMIMGIDPRKDDAGRSDTLMLVTLNEQKKSASVLSIPRDTRTVIDDNGYDKINHAYAYGGHDCTQKAVEHLLNVPVDYYVMIDLHAFERIIDAIDGIDLEVEKRMYYEDPWDDNGGLVIDLYPGMQHLDGERAMEYVRFRDEEGDIGRIRRQQKFLNALLTKAVSPETLSRIPKILDELKSVIHTNMPLSEMVALSKHLPQIRSNGVETIMLPGQPAWWNGTSYWLPDIQGSRELVASQMGLDMTSEMKETAEMDTEEYNRNLPDGLVEVNGTLMINGDSTAVAEEADRGKKEKRKEKKAEDKKSRETKRRELKPEDITIRVLNESGINGAGAETAEILKSKGFKISDVGNGETTSREKTAFSVPEQAVDLFYNMPFDCIIMANDESTQAVLRIGKDYR